MVLSTKWKSPDADKLHLECWKWLLKVKYSSKISDFGAGCDRGVCVWGGGGGGGGVK